MPPASGHQRTPSDRSSVDPRSGHLRTPSAQSNASATGASPAPGRQRLAKIAQGHASFSEMVLMQSTVEDCLLVAKYVPDDTEAYGVPFLAPTTNAKDVAKSVKLTHHHPGAYKQLRAHFRVDTDEYYRAVCCTHWAYPSAGGNKVFFAGNRFCISILTPKESQALARMAPEYRKYITANPMSLLPQIYGHHEARVHTKTVHFFVHNNVVPFHRAVSTAFKVGKASKFKPSPLSDMGVGALSGPGTIAVGPQRKVTMLGQLDRDLDFLEQHKLSNYDLVVGLQRRAPGDPPSGWDALSAQPPAGGASPRTPTTSEAYQVGISGVLKNAGSLGSKFGFFGLTGPKGYRKKFAKAVKGLVT